MQVIVIAIIAFNLIQLYAFGHKNPHQKTMYKGAMLTHELQGPIGAWNSGLLGYFGEDVINLDGLANNEIQPYIKAGLTNQYIKQKGIKYIFDRHRVLTRKTRQLRCGYGEDLINRLIEVHRFGVNGVLWRIGKEKK